MPERYINNLTGDFSICFSEHLTGHPSWQLNPDGMYFMDEDGFGMTDDDEVEIYGFIDRQGKILVKFQHINEDWKRLEIMKKEAETKVGK